MLAACGLIHLNPSWINGLLRELLDHRLADPQEVSSLDRKCSKFLSTRVCGALVSHDGASTLRSGKQRYHQRARHRKKNSRREARRKNRNIFVGDF